MPVVSSITLADGQGTPANHTFSPAGRDGNTYFFEDRTVSAYPIGYTRLSLSLRRPSQGSDVWKLVVKVDKPTLEEFLTGSTTGYKAQPKVAYTISSKVEVLIPGRAISAERYDSRAYTANLLNHALVLSMWKDLDSIYG